MPSQPGKLKIIQSFLKYLDSNSKLLNSPKTLSFIITFHLMLKLSF